MFTNTLEFPDMVVLPFPLYMTRQSGQREFYVYFHFSTVSQNIGRPQSPAKSALSQLIKGCKQAMNSGILRVQKKQQGSR